MTLITPEDRVLHTAELLQSLQESIRKLRNTLEDLRQRIQAGEDADCVSTSKEMAAAETLLRSCQKVEAHLVEQQNRQAGIVQGGYALDLDRARFEIGCRLARLRTCCRERPVPD